MEDSMIETTYPLNFRAIDARGLGNHIKNRHSVVIIGMRRVGISNFLRFLLHHENIINTYIGDNKNHLFIPVDLNDLTEREIFPFWMLTLKRIADKVEKSALNKEAKREIENLFLKDIQSQDLFLTIENVRKAVLILVENNILPTLFLLRFDRIKEAVTPDFFSNLQGLREASHHRLSYVFTSFRGLDSLAPDVFKKAALSMFARNMYLRPAKRIDAEIILGAFKNRYKLKIPIFLERKLFEIVDGYVQYLQLALIFLHEEKRNVKNEFELFEYLAKDERIGLQSEELWESLENQEKAVLIKIIKGQEILKEDEVKGKYLWDTGLIVERNRGKELFSPLFEHFLKQKIETNKNNGNIFEFTKKENLLFKFLQDNDGKICEREKIIEIVWPEEEELGVSDWAIDRLVARVRNKLKQQKSSDEIITIRTRGYKLSSVNQ